MNRATQLIERLALEPHPEGGFYRETFRAEATVQTPKGARSASTAIYFLLPDQTFSAWHRVSSDEAWHLYEGELELHTLDEDGHTVIRLGRDRPQHVIAAGVWQAAKPVGYALCGCTVAPGFDFADFDLPSRAALLEVFPEQADAVRAFTR